VESRTSEHGVTELVFGLLPERVGVSA